jgi:hypothetical protein
MSGWQQIALAAAGPLGADAAARRDPAGQQNAWLLDLLGRNAGTEYGRRHGFAAIRDHRDYARRVPVVRYDHVASEIARIADGEADILTADPVIAFEETSGSLAGRKLIPYTRAGLADFENAALVWLQRLAGAYPGIAAGKAYWSISPAGRRPSRTPGGLPIGFASDAGYFSAENGAALASLSAVPFAAGGISDMETWRFFTLRMLLACEELSFISVWSPTFLALLLDAIPQMAGEIVAAIHDGRLGRDLPAALCPGLQPQPARARRIARALRNPQVGALWPRLTAISAWSHGAARAPFDRLRRRLPGVACEGKGLMATEGVMSIPDPLRAYPLPALASAFVEFIDADGVAHLTHQLEPDAHYQIVITTRSGLYRYAPGDEVACRRAPDGMAEIEFLGRSGVACDLVGEKLDESFVAVCLGGIDADALLAPLDQPLPGYVLMLDADAPLPNIAGLEHRLAANPHYAYARRLGQLGRIAAHRCVDLKGTYQRFRVSQGQRLGDIKPPALLRSPADTAEFLAFLETESEIVLQTQPARWRTA